MLWGRGGEKRRNISCQIKAAIPLRAHCQCRCQAHLCSRVCHPGQPLENSWPGNCNAGWINSSKILDAKLKCAEMSCFDPFMMRPKLAQLWVQTKNMGKSSFCSLSTSGLFINFILLFYAWPGNTSLLLLTSLYIWTHILPRITVGWALAISPVTRTGGLLQLYMMLFPD